MSDLTPTPSVSGDQKLVEDPDSAAPVQRDEENVVEEIAAEDITLLKGWRKPRGDLSLQEVNGSIGMPGPNAKWYSKMFAFTGLGFMVSVGYMDPGNWATDLSGGASFGYMLLTVVMMSSFIAMFLQSLSLKLGIVGERDLAQACRDAYPKYVNYVLWIIAEVAIAATDLAEVIGSATALFLLFNIPLWAGVLITAGDVLFILLFGTKNFRFLELVVFMLVVTIAGCFSYELATADPEWGDVARGLIPSGSIITDPAALYNAIGILGATVMPHNLFLHSSIIQTRAYPRTTVGKKMAVFYGTWDSTVSLCFAFFVNASILILAACAFHYGPNPQKDVASLEEAYHLLSPALGADAARILFGVALLCSGQNSTITGTLSGQIVMEGFLQLKLKPWMRRIITRLIAIIPAVIITSVAGSKGAGKLLVLSQVILSLALPFAIGPLVHFTSSKAKMGQFVNGIVAKVAAGFIWLVISGLNFYLIVQSIRKNQFGNA